ncbi:hypothetical protein ACFQV4_29790 [Streptomyces thermocarboxydus]
MSDLMDERLTLAALAVAVNTALRVPDADGGPVDLADVLRVPAAVEPWRPPVDLYPTPAAALLQRARARLERDGWCQGATVDQDGARCLYGRCARRPPTPPSCTTRSPSCWTPSAGTSPTRRPCPASRTPTGPAPSSACWTRPRTSRTPATSDHRRSTTSMTLHRAVCCDVDACLALYVAAPRLGPDAALYAAQRAGWEVRAAVSPPGAPAAPGAACPSWSAGTARCAEGAPSPPPTETAATTAGTSSPPRPTGARTPTRTRTTRLRCPPAPTDLPTRTGPEV